MQSFNFTMPGGTSGTGNFQVTLTTDYGQTVPEYDSNGNPAYGNNTATTTFTSTLASYADLTIPSSSVSVAPTSPQSSGQVTVTWNDQNIGTAAVNAAFYDYVLVQRVNSNNTLTTVASSSVNGNSTLAAGATSAQQAITFTLPDGAAGTGSFQVTITTDYGQTVQEYDSNGNPAYGNNTATTTFTSTLASDADLVVKAGSLSVTPGSLQSGNQATVDWMDQNIGNAAVNASFSDYVLVQRVNANNSLTTVASGTVSGNNTLAAGATSGTQSFNFTLPNGASGTGTFQVTVATDYYQTVKEYDSNGNPAYGNNTATTSFSSTLASYADLTVKSGSLSVLPGSLQSGNQATVNWMDQNIGNAAVNASFYDYVLVQRVNPDNSLTYIASGDVNGNNTLAAGATSGAQSFNFTLPDGSPGVGNFVVTLTTDNGQSVPEYDNNGNPAYGNNSATTNFTSTLAAYPDLQVANPDHVPGDRCGRPGVWGDVR